jgi:hypothetical protein
MAVTPNTIPEEPIRLNQGTSKTYLILKEVSKTVDNSNPTQTIIGVHTFEIPRGQAFSEPFEPTNAPFSEMLQEIPKSNSTGDYQARNYHLLPIEVSSGQAENDGRYDIGKHDETLYPHPGTVKIADEQKALENALHLYFGDCADDDKIVARTSTHFDIKVGNSASAIPGLNWSVIEKPPGSPELSPNEPNRPIRTIANNNGNMRGGLYKFRLNGASGIEPQVWLPLAGPDITEFWQSEIDYFRNTWGPAYRQNMVSSVQPLIDMGASGQAAASWLQAAAMDMHRLGGSLDWIGSPKGEYSPCGGPDKIGDEWRLTIAGVVVDFRKRNNMMYALIGTQMGMGVGFLAVAADSPLATGAADDEYARESYFAGSDLSAGADLTEVMQRRGRFMQKPGTWAHKEWPSWETTSQKLTRAQAQLLQELIQP